MEAEARWRGMGADVHVIINGDPLLMRFVRRQLDQLENKWSRFLPYSEITKLNNSTGAPFEVSPETAELIVHALEGYRITNGMFDPTILGDLLRLGYHTSFVALEDADAPEVVSELKRGASDIKVNGNQITLPLGAGFDPGGIGKGFAADLIAEEVMKRGASGVLINVGGDIRVMGKSPEGGGWKIDITDHNNNVIECVVLSHGAIATSTTMKRTWSHEDHVVHHLIDPALGINADTHVMLASVITAQCWQAEILTKALMIGKTDMGMKLTQELGAQALSYTSDNEFVTTQGWDSFRCEEVCV